MMKLLTIIAFASVAIVSAGGPTHPRVSPKGVVQEFFQFETSGGRLTPKGWREAGKFFVRPIPAPIKRQIYVIDKYYSVWNKVQAIQGGAVRVTVGVGFQGRIDSEMRLIPVEGEGGGRVMLDLILTKNYWVLDPDGREKEITGPPEWRIKPSSIGTMIFLTTDAAIRYVTEMRNKTRDAAIRRDADRTIAVLKRYR